MNLDLYISELLFDHDCVIIPGFGGIVANYRSSFLNPAHHTFSPPSKKLAFNASLRINDGLLANHISKQLHIPYQEAYHLIQEFVEGCLSTLKDGQKLTIKNVGELYFDREHNLQFIPDLNINYLKASFGLYSIHSPSIKRGNHQPEAIPFSSIASRKKRDSGKTRKLWRIIEVVPVAAVMLWLFINPNVIRKLNEQAASFNPINQYQSIELPKAKKPEISIQESQPVVTEVKKQNKFDLPPSPTEKTDQPSAFEKQYTATTIETKKEAPIINLKSDIGFPSPNSEKVASIEKKTSTAANSGVNLTSSIETPPEKLIGKMYYIIGGAFGVFENAEKFRDKLIEDGFQAAIIGQNDKGLHLVSLFSSVDQHSASKELVLIKEKAEAKAWLLHK